MLALLGSSALSNAAPAAGGQRAPGEGAPARGAARSAGAVPGAAASSKAAAAQAPPDVEEVMRRLNDLYRSKRSHALMRMEIKTEFYERTLTLEAWTEGLERSLIVVRAPPREAGTATLKTEDGLWSYAPRADRLVRIPPGLLSEAWMGSHLTNDDLVRETDFVKDYRTQGAWVEEGGRRLFEATMVPRPEAPVVYTKIRYLVDPEHWVPVRAEFFDGDEVVRVMRFESLRDFGGRLLPAVMTVVPTDRPHEYTRLEYQRLEFDVRVDPSLFTPRGLRRVAKR
ncbi:MAG: outer membrane lipoprotein-sorting protein [Deltaproteobacteria bacterium]|nr:MAG: outer membrane lipoprotein-sorting protein [Deltaproteobacteria bacterium]